MIPNKTPWFLVFMSLVLFVALFLLTFSMEVRIAIGVWLLPVVIFAMALATALYSRRR